MKTNKSKLIVLFTILLAAVCMLISYPFIDEKAKNMLKGYSDDDRSEEIYNAIFVSSIPHYYELKKQIDPEIQPYEVFLKDANEVNIQQVAQNITDSINDQAKRSEDTYGDISYYIFDQNSDAYITNVSDITKMKQLANGETIPNLWYTVFSLDEYGIMTISQNTSGYQSSYLSSEFEYAYHTVFNSNQLRLRTEYSTETGTYSLYFNDQDTGELQPITNTTFVFSLDQETIHQLFPLDSYEYMNSRYAYREYIMPFFFAISFVLIIALWMFYRGNPKDLPLFRWFKKIPMEVHPVLFTFLIAYVMEIGAGLVQFSLQGEHTFFIGGEANSPFGILYLIVGENFLPWFLCFTYIAYLAIACKDMWKRKAWREYFITRKVLHLMKVKLHSMIDFISSIDLSEHDDKRILTAIGINFVIMMVLILMWGFGLFFLFLYSIFLFYLAKKYLKSIRHDYETLLDVTKHMAIGNLDGEITTDLGIFNDFKENMVDIRSGFKQAVEEEVHSQRMKTELITNVSHDLKTPLTSIITYIDLLKKEDISDAERKKYMDTLDRNSIRLKHLIDDLFEVSKATSGTMHLDQMNMDIISLMKQVEVELETQLHAKKLTIKNHFSDEKILCYLDPQKTYRIFENLVSNIAKYAMKQSRVYIDITDYGQRVDVTLRNISAVEMNFDPEDITERFTRGDASRNTDGSGLGLAIAKSFTELQGGTMRISIDGDLFKVHLCFPKHEVEEQIEE